MSNKLSVQMKCAIKFNFAVISYFSVAEKERRPIWNALQNKQVASELRKRKMEKKVGSQREKDSINMFYAWRRSIYVEHGSSADGLQQCFIYFFFSVYVTFQYLPFNRFHSKCMIQVTANNFFQYIYNVKVNPMFVVFFFLFCPSLTAVL